MFTMSISDLSFYILLKNKVVKRSRLWYLSRATPSAVTSVRKREATEGQNVSECLGLLMPPQSYGDVLFRVF